MPVRNVDGERYFNELAASAEKYFIPYINEKKSLTAGMSVLEFGCGQGGILLPFARMGCCVTGVDLDAPKIEDGKRCFAREGLEANLIADNLFNMKELERSFDVIVCHDVIEHISDKRAFLEKIRDFLKDDGVIFFGFPAWQMPFGGHQQNCRSRLVSHWPFLHLLPAGIYRRIMKAAGESESTIADMLDIKKTATPIELFEKLVREGSLRILDRTLYFINPHYEVKFGLRPRKLCKPLSAIPWLRNFFSTGCFYLVAK